MENFLKGIKDTAKKAGAKVKKTVADFFTPDANPDVRIGEFLREVPGATGKVALDIAQSIPRSILSTALTVAPKKTQESIGEIRPSEDFGTVGKWLLGEAPIKRIPEMGKDTLESLGLEEGKAKTFGPVAGFALTALDLFPGTAGKGKLTKEGAEALLKEVVKETDVKTVATALGRGGFDRATVSQIAPEVAKATTDDEVRAILTAAREGAQEAPVASKPKATKKEPEVPAKERVEARTAQQGEIPKGVEGMPSIGEIMARGGGDTPRPPKPPVAEGAGKGKTPKQPERRFVTRAREMDQGMDPYLKGQYEVRNTEALAKEADDLIARDPQAAETLARTGTDDKAVATASRLVDNLVTQAREATGATKDALYEKAATVANEAAANLTEAGRAVQAASLLGRLTPEGMVRWAARQIQRHNEGADMGTIDRILKGKVGGSRKKVPELTGKQAQEITDEMERIAKMPEGEEKVIAMQKLEDRVRSFIPSSLYDKIITVWKAGLLTGLKTSGLNILSNASHTATEVLKDIPAALVDRIVSLFTGKRTLAFTAKGQPTGMAEGVGRGWKYLKTGYDIRDVGKKLEHTKVNFGDSKLGKAIQAYEEAVFRTIGAQDQPFYYGAKARSLYSQAIAKAKTEGLKGKAYRDRIQELIEKPTDDMLKYATLDAETAVFQNKTQLGKAARAIQNLPGGQIVLPFGKTPSAVATQMINYTPVGMAATIIRSIGKGKFDQRLFSQAMGRGITGTAALAIGMELMKNDMISLAWPSSEKERQQWELEGRLPNTIKIGGKWRNIGILGPAGMVLVIGGNIQDGIDETGSFTGGLAQAAGGAGSALTEQSFLKGINQAIDAIKDPKRSFEGFASSLAGSVVPTIIADIARAMDDKERRTESPMERIQSRIPLARLGLEPKVDAFGKEIETPNLFEVMADPTRPGNATAPNDPITRELRRLVDAGHPATPTELGDRKGYESLEQEQNTLLWKAAGRLAYDAMENLMKRPAYAKADDEQKAKLIQKVTDDAKVEARARIVVEATKGLTGDDLTEKLLEMREDGLLTKEVYGLYRKFK